MTPTDANLLIVDDKPANLHLLNDMLREQGYTVRGVRSGERALATAEANPPDLVLLDINMPEMDGYEVCKRFKADERLRAIPVIFLSALDEALDKVKAFEVGGVDYIAKPFQLEEVLVRIDNHLTLSRMQEQLRQADRAKSTFLANMSHEIRTPMNAILGYAQILADHPALDAQLRPAVDIIRTSGDHLLGLINDILDLSKIEAGREELHPADFELTGFAAGLSAMFRLRCEQKGLEWQEDVALKPQRVFVDENKLRQILVNLLGNALKFTGEGRVRLQIAAGKGRHFRFMVEDTGPGIDPAHQAAIFDPFHQDAEGLAQGGTGLGLTIARRHVELLGGQLKLDSEPGGGTRFSFEIELPLHEGEPGAEPEQPWALVTRLQPGTEVDALVVDDVDTNRDILAQFLEPIGVAVRLANDGESALQAVRDARPDIVFLDIQLPDIKGTEVFTRLVEEHGAGSMKVVAVSASVLDHERRRCLELGFDAFVGKPFRKEELYACLAELLEVEYEYAQEEQAVALPSVALPQALYDQLKEALRIRNVTMLDRLFDDIEALGAAGGALAARLRELSQQYDLKAIAGLLDENGPA